MVIGEMIVADITLSDGRELTADLSQLTIGQYRQLLNPQQEQVEEDETIGRVFGLTAVEVVNLPYPDYRRLTSVFFKRAADPLADPKNSPSEST